MFVHCTRFYTFVIYTFLADFKLLLVDVFIEIIKTEI